MPIDNNTFCWNSINTTNIEGALAFYPKALGWTVQSMPSDNGDLHLFAAADIPRAHIDTHDTDGTPPRWDSFLRVEDVAETAAAAATNGGTVLVPPMDVGKGQFAMLATPSGAPLCLWRENGDDSNGPSGPGSLHWTELHSTDVDADLAFMTKTFGFDTGTMPMPDGGTYYLLKNGDKMCGGLMATQQPKAPSHFLAWFEVTSADDTLVRIKEAGGSAFSEATDYPGVGRMAVVADPMGAVFGVLQPS